MNSSNSTTQLEISEVINYLWTEVGGFGLVIFAPLFIIALALGSVLSFPIYCVIRNKNLAKEKESPIYPIVDHFFLYSCLIFGCITIPFICWLFDNHVLLEYGLGIIVTVVYILMVTLSPIFNILLIILTLQRFLLYYVEDSEKYMSFKILHWRLFFGALYMISTTFNCGIRVAKYVLVVSKPFNNSFEIPMTDNEIINSIDDTFMNLAIALEVLVIVSAALYIPMFHSIQKLAYLPSVAQYQPQKYVKYQALLISVMKSFMFLLAFFGAGPVHNFLLWPTRELAFVFLSFSTFFTTPLIIQMTYIFCNKRNVKIMLSYMSVEKLVDKLKLLFRRNNNVHPVV
ncbi:hypothetical protein CRE_14505 [Caenorhabditis remanei]|uniref:Serpentine Receptor, class Z n=1 Tax=Caenorhabditis remanei TaxID=31234 RepID=E3M993_CAERE|nr:hypothetical protein CRE_14505 [Caenorhabditis remanei]